MANRKNTETSSRPNRLPAPLFMSYFNSATQLKWMLAAAVSVLILTACGGSDGAAGTASTSVEDQIASGIATQQAIETQIAAGVAATASAQEEIQPTPTATSDLPASTPATVPPSPTALPPAPTGTPVPPEPTATSVPPAPTSTPVPALPMPTSTPVPPPATPMPELPDLITFERPEDGRHTIEGTHGSFAQGSGTWEVTAFPARTYVRSAVYFGINEDVRSHTALTSTFVANRTGSVTVTTDVSWSGVFTTFGVGDMTSNLNLQLFVNEPLPGGGDGVSLAEPPSIQPRDDREPTAGNESFKVNIDVEEGVTYTITMTATCQSIGSRNGLASDTECIFDNKTGDGGYVEWSNLTVEYLP